MDQKMNPLWTWWLWLYNYKPPTGTATETVIDLVIRESNNNNNNNNTGRRLGLGGYCDKEKKACVGWVNTYFKDCLCNLTDELSFGFGLISLVAWAVAEIPQIITNFRTKSSHGVSILFLLTWVFGDIFNLAGCVLEPATLPTQYYTALLYTVSTLVLLFQSLYYDHLYSWFSNHKLPKTAPTHLHLQDDEDEHQRPLIPKDDTEDGGGGGGGIPIPSAPRRSARPRPHSAYYFTSARSLAGSSTPPFRSYLTAAKSGPSAVDLGQEHSSSEDENDVSSIPVSVTTRAAKPVPIPRSAKRGVAVAASVSLPMHTNAMAAAYKGLTGRKLLQEGVEHSALGQWLGWMMAAIYMGGRIPQIVLNIQRGSVEGLNPLMFVFALVANVAYVASILVRSREWKKIQANMPWLLDAVVCVALDLFIIMQYVYYKYMRKKESRDEDEDPKGTYMEAEPKYK